MKKFLLQFGIFILLLCFIFYSVHLFWLYNDRYKRIVAGCEVYYSIKKSKLKKKCKKLIIGDSVGKQLFNNETFNDSIYSLACNQAISLVGQYILLNNYINTGNIPDEVFLLYSPRTFADNLDQDITFNYFLKPFYKEEYFQYISSTAKNQIQKIPNYEFCSFPVILTSNWSPNLTSTYKKDYTFLSPISIEYIKKMKVLSLEKKFKLIILPEPINKSYKEELKQFKNEIIKNDLQDIFGSYYENIIYLDKSYFKDKFHLKNPQEFTDYYINTFLK